MIDRLPLRDFGLENIPAVPYLFNFSEPLLTLFHLARRSLEVEPAKNGLSNTFTIHGQTATAHDFLYGSFLGLAEKEYVSCGATLRRWLHF